MTRFICLLASVAVFAHAGAQAQQAEGDGGDSRVSEGEWDFGQCE